MDYARIFYHTRKHFSLSQGVANNLRNCPQNKPFIRWAPYKKRQYNCPLLKKGFSPFKIPTFIGADFFLRR
jgi:hypothetical protein